MFSKWMLLRSKDSNTCVFLWILPNFYEQFFHRTPPLAASALNFTLHFQVVNSYCTIWIRELLFACCLQICELLFTNCCLHIAYISCSLIQGCYRIFMNDYPDFSIKYSVFPLTSALTTIYIFPDLSLDNYIYFPWPQPWTIYIFPDLVWKHRFPPDFFGWPTFKDTL